MRALVWQGPHRMAVEEAPEPSAPAGWVVVRPGAAGVCGSEVEGYLGRMANRVPPLVMGHEFAGEVVVVGPDVETGWMGKRVAINPIVGCGRCSACRADAPNLCADRTLVGAQHPGGFAERVAVPVECLVELPAGLDLRLGALVEPLANGVHAAGLGLTLGPVERAVVIGGGMIGLACLQGALLSGVGSVTVVEPNQTRREIAAGLGATAVHGSLADVEPAVDLVLDAVGTAATRRAAVELVRQGGVCVFLGLHDDESGLPFHSVIRKSVTIRGSYAYARAEFARALEWVADGRAGIGELTPVLPLERGPDVFAELAAGPPAEIKVFLGG